MTPTKDTPRGRPRSQQALLARLRDKGLGLAPVVAKPSSKSGPARALAAAPVADLSHFGTVPHEAPVRPADRHTAPGTVFEFVIPAPAEFLNANRDKGHWSGSAPKVKAWRRAGKRAAAAAGLPQGLARLQVDCFVIKPIQNSYDPANWAPTAKACLDGMIDYGLAEDDNRRFVTGPFMHEGGRGDDALGVKVTVLASSS